MVTEQEVAKFREVISNFDIPENEYEFYSLKRGNINKTYLAVSEKDGKKYVLQKINNYVFKDPEKIIGNIKKVTSENKRKIEEENSSEETIRLIKSNGGKPFFKDSEGGHWRCMNFIEGQVYDHISDDEQGNKLAFEAGRIFGKFQERVQNINPEDLHVTIPNFQCTTTKYNEFLDALKRDPKNRAKDCKKEIDFFMSKRYIKEKVKEIHEKVPKRTTHNDTKINNVIFNVKGDEKDKAKAVIDLDTVMPGIVLYDLGDLIMFSTCPAEEDETDLSKVVFSKELCKEIIRGYLHSTNKFLTKEEIDNLAYSPILMCYNLGLRFLTDYLNGDVYFMTDSARKHHNLERARTRIALLKQFEEDYKDIEKMINDFKSSF